MAWTGLREAIRNHSFSFRVTVGLLVLVASVAAIVISKRPAPARTSTIEARLELASGEVTLKQGSADSGRDASALTVISGIPLPTGAELATGKGARALVRLSDGSAIFLRHETQIALKPTGIELAQGEVWLDAPPSEKGGLVHRLGDVTLSATEAGLSLRRAGADVTVYVTRGLAVVTAPGGRIEVNAGEQATIAGKAPPKVASLAYWEDWTGGMGDHPSITGEGSGSGRIYGIDRNAPTGTPARTLEISRQVVRAVIRDGLAETEVDQTFGNPGGREVEGWYWFSVPERAVVTSFAVETDGHLVEGEVIERQEAAAKYQAAIRAAHEPALLEWIDGRSYRARIFPVPASGSRRVVLRYMELVATASGKFEYVYPLRSGDSARRGRGTAEPAAIGEFSLSVDLGEAGVGKPLSTLADAVIEDGGRRVSMRRSGYAPRADFQLEGELAKVSGPLRVARFSAGGDRADYLMARYVPDVDWSAVKDLPSDLAVVVDTSASADEAARQQKAAAAEAILRSLSPSDHFTLIALDASPTVLYPKEGLAEAQVKEIATALERLADHQSGGATDLGALFDTALGRVHGKEQPAVIYIGDGLATSGEVSADKLGERLRRSLSVSRARFFTVAVGTGANYALLHELARTGGGQAFRIDNVEGSTAEVLRLASAIKTPTITDLDIDLGAGLDEPMLTQTGKVSRGEELILLARTHHALPENATVKGRLGGKDFTREYRLEIDAGIGTALVPRLWASEKIRRLLGSSTDPEEHRGKVVELGIDYGLVTPFTSILALESEQAYQQQGIKRRSSPLRGVRLTALDPVKEREALAALFPPSPAAAMGCSKSEQAMEMQQSSPAAAAPPAKLPSKYEASNQKDQAPPPQTVAAVPEPMAMATAAAAADPHAAAAEEPGRLPTEGARRESAPARMARGPGGGGAKAKAFSNADPLGDKDGPSDEIVAATKPPPAPPPPPRAMASTAPKPTPALAKIEPARAGFLAQNQKKIEPKKPDDARAPAPKPAAALGFCSDTARRPLAERIVVWSNRLRRASAASELIDRYDGARSTCEIPDWRSQAALLDLIEARVRSEGAAEAVLKYFAEEREAQKYVAHGILRRTVDPRIVAVVRRALFNDKARWPEIDNDLAALASPADKLSRLRQVLLSFPDDPEGELRLVRLLAESNQKDEALAVGRRLRDRGFMSPALAQSLGDVLAGNGFTDDAVRTYSEIIEFDPLSADSRRLLGDIYLRHRWYPAAYRQYKTLIDIADAEPLTWLRLAAAAAGSGRVDEALRIQRQVATAEGTPGPTDPRAFARLLSAAHLGRLLAESNAPEGQSESVARKLKELQLWSGPSALCILTWEDFESPLALVSLEGDKETPVGEASDAAPVGLAAVLLPTAELSRLRFVARLRSDPRGRNVDLMFHTLVWDGKTFNVKVRPATLPAKDKEIAL
jgi:Ca-activated chloride channel family protein